MADWEMVGEGDADATYGEVKKPKLKVKMLKAEDLQGLILWEDADFFVINKPPLISTLDERAKGFGVGLLRLAKEAFGDVQAAHRLDKETSGCLAFAKNPAAYRHLAMQFENREVTKIYHALANGVHQLEGVRVYLPILLMNGGYVVIDKVEGKEAETIFNTLKNYKFTTLVECYPITGRMHQIRIHLAQLDAPIVADTRYGGKHLFLRDLKRKKFTLKKGTEELPLISRVALHARELNFAKMDGERVHVIAPYPKDIEAVLNQLDKYSK